MSKERENELRQSKWERKKIGEIKKVKHRKRQRVKPQREREKNMNYRKIEMKKSNYKVIF